MVGGGDGQREKWRQESPRRQRRKNLVLGVVLAALALLFYLITVVRMGENLFNR